MLTRAFGQTLGSGEFDLAMFVVNFVDRHTYNFEDKVIPAAKKHNAGVVAMKVLGGSASGYESRDQRAMMADSDIEPAIHYAVGCPAYRRPSSAAETSSRSGGPARPRGVFGR